MLARSPEPDARNQDVVRGGGPANTHCFERALNPVPGQGYPHGAAQYYQSHPPQPSSVHSYGNVYGTLNRGPETGHVSYEHKKWGYDALNEFVGDLKPRRFDPNSYATAGQWLPGLQNLSLSTLAGGLLPEYQVMPVPVAVAAGGHGPAYRLWPLSNVRTKDDLVKIDHIQQMRGTIYESDGHVAAAGVPKPNVHYTHNGMSYRTTNLPPTQLLPTHATATTTTTTSTVPGWTVATAHAPSTGTPALTFLSSAQSCGSCRSPISPLSGVPLSPPQHDGGPTMYPRLPSATVADSMIVGYSTASSAAPPSAPPSALGSTFDHEIYRRYTGGTLQRSRPEERRLSDAMDPTQNTKDDSDRTPIARSLQGSASSSPGRIPASLVGPASSGSPSEMEASTRAVQAVAQVAEPPDVRWVEMVGLIDYLRNYIASHLEWNKYKGDSDRQSASHSRALSHGGHLEGIECETRLAAVEQRAPAKTESGGDAVMYPTLRGLEDEGITRRPIR